MSFSSKSVARECRRSSRDPSIPSLWSDIKGALRTQSHPPSRLRAAPALGEHAAADPPPELCAAGTGAADLQAAGRDLDGRFTVAGPDFRQRTHRAFHYHVQL